VAKGLSVREVEALVRRETTAPPAPPPSPKIDPNIKAAEERLKMALGTRVRIIASPSGARGGRIEIDFASAQELQRIFELLTAR
jgi:hypothetical protein